MKLFSRWKEKLQFTVEADGHSLEMDTKPPLGAGSAMSPKQLVVAGLCGCTGMDVAALLRKYKQPLESLSIEADVTSTEGSHPVVFKQITLTFRLTGAVDHEKVKEAVHLSQSKFCGVSAMLSKAVPMNYLIEVNGEVIGKGKPEFAN